MATTLMGRQKKNPAGDGGEKGRVSLKASPEAGELIHQIAGMRGLSVEKLLDADDFQAFFKHALVAEFEKATERHRLQPRR